MSRATLGSFTSLAQAEEAVDFLTSDRFASGDISVLMQDTPRARLAAGTLGLLAGIDTISIAGAGSFIAAGSISSLLASVPARSGESQLEVPLMEGLGISRAVASSFGKRLSEGAILLSVQCRNLDDQNRAAEVLRNAGAEEIESIGNSRTAPLPARELPKEVA
jgi:hypothetical protein